MSHQSKHIEPPKTDDLSKKRHINFSDKTGCIGQSQLGQRKILFASLGIQSSPCWGVQTNSIKGDMPSGAGRTPQPASGHNCKQVSDHNQDNVNGNYPN